jgi:nitrogen fixation NifU-like protein
MNERELSELYQQVILQHNKSPRNFGELPEATHKAEGFNPLCGDHFHVALVLNEDGIVSQVKFSGEGCAISKAAASMMTQAVTGKSIADVQRLFGEFHALVTGKLDPENQSNHLGHLKIFAGIRKFPARVKCASLSWHAVVAALDKKNQISTE